MSKKGYRMASEATCQIIDAFRNEMNTALNENKPEPSFEEYKEIMARIKGKATASLFDNNHQDVCDALATSLMAKMKPVLAKLAMTCILEADSKEEAMVVMNEKSDHLIKSIMQEVEKVEAEDEPEA